MYLVISKCVTAVKVSNFSGHYLRNRSTLDIGVLGYIGTVQHKEHSPEVLSIPPGTPCIITMCQYRSKIFQICHILKEFIACSMVVILSREHSTEINLVRKSWAEKRRNFKYVNSPSLRGIGEMEVKLQGFLTLAPHGSEMSVSSSTLFLNISNFESPHYAFLVYSILRCGFIRGHSAGCNRTPDASSNSQREHPELKSR